MSMGTLARVAAVTDGTLVGADAHFDSVSTDTRSLGPGQLFFALRGERFDGSKFLAEAEQRGAAGAVVERRQALGLPQVEVADARQALGAYARAWRKSLSLPLVGVTGSNGKTTVKEMTGAILRAAAGSAGPDSVLVTRGNLNNEIGMPIMLLRLRSSHRAAVIEMGASRQGDIAYLAGIAMPSVGIVTNAGPAHLEGFGGSVRDVAVAKGELFAALPTGGTAVINRDDEFCPYWQGIAGRARIVTFGLSEGADYQATDIRPGPGPVLEFRLHTPAGTIPVRLPMAGRHNVVNAAGAAAAAAAAGADPAAIAAGLAAMANVSGRLKPVAGPAGSTLYDDSYNANPGSMAAAIDFLAGQGGRNWIVLGDMAELGPASADLHRQVGALAARPGIERLYCVGEQSRHMAAGYGPAARWYADVPALTAALLDELEPGVTVLVKASRSMGLERLVHALAGGTREEMH